mgnify:CR=1 FL=1
MSENSDILLDTNSHDLDTSGYTLHLSDGLAATAQRIKIRLKFFLGEWFLDTAQGVPYYEDILVKNPDLNIVKADLQKQILTTPEVKELLSFDLALNNQTRTLNVTFSALTTSGLVEDELVLP